VREVLCGRGSLTTSMRSAVTNAIDRVVPVLVPGRLNTLSKVRHLTLWRVGTLRVKQGESD